MAAKEDRRRDTRMTRERRILFQYFILQTYEMFSFLDRVLLISKLQNPKEGRSKLELNYIPILQTVQQLIPFLELQRLPKNK